LKKFLEKDFLEKIVKEISKRKISLKEKENF
jgi:hypothetical protein